MTSPSFPVQNMQNAPQDMSMSDPGAEMSSLRTTKRKLDDAIQSLDNAVGSSSFPQPTERPTPAKKQLLSRSLYSTLAKYGIKSKEAKSYAENSLDNANLAKKAPHLAAILARTHAHSRKDIPFKVPSIPHLQTSARSTTEYRPSSTQSFLTRLGTFKLATYANKPATIDAVAASKCGWINEGKDRLLCGVCGASWVVVGKEGMTKEAANVFIEKQRLSLVQAHKNGCPWRTRQCDDSIYRVPLQPPSAMARELKSKAVLLEPVLEDVQIRHPLSTTQLKTLRAILATMPSSRSFVGEGPSPMQVDGDSDAPFVDEPSDTAILTSLFGWTLPPPAPERPRTTSLTRTSSYVPSRSSTPSHSRASSVSLTLKNDVTPGSSSLTRSMTSISSQLPDIGRICNKRDNTLLYCPLCQRRVGLWAFAPPHQPPKNGSSTNGHETPPTTPKPRRQFDLLKEHRSYCPYVVRSSAVPSLPVPPGGSTTTTLPQVPSTASEAAIEGWRAVLAVISRHGLGQRQRMSLTRTISGASNETPNEGGQEGWSDLEGVEYMVAGVKSRGGRDLLKYVKGLLG